MATVTNAMPKHSSEKPLQRWRKLRKIVENRQAEGEGEGEAEAVRSSNKVSLEKPLQRWRKLFCTVLRNPKRRFRSTPKLSKQLEDREAEAEAEAVRRYNKVSSEKALQRWRKLCTVVRNPKRRFRFTANLSPQYEAEAVRRSNHVSFLGCHEVLNIVLEVIPQSANNIEEKFRVAVSVFQAVLRILQRLNLSRDEENAAGFQICADEMESAGITDRMVTGDNLNTGKSISRECGILTDKGLAIEGAEFQTKIEEKLCELIQETQAPNWSQLPSDLISAVADQFSTIEDFAASLQVNHHWHSVCSNMNWTQGPQPPWLMLSESPNSNWRSFFSLYNNVWYKLELPTVRGRQCYGTAQGWIIAVGPDFQSHCLHPLLKVKINLPVLSALQNQIGVLTDWFNIIQKFIAFKISDDQFLVMAIYGPSSCLAYVKPGDSEWVIFEGSHFKDVTFFQGHYYALCGRGTLIHCQLSDGSVDVVDYPPRDLKTADKMYLVESSGKLFAVFRYGFATVFDNLYKTESFLVYKYQFDVPDNPFDPNDVFDSDDPNELVPVDLDDDRFDPNDPPPPRWARVKDLEDGAFFVGNGNSWSVCAGNTVNCKRNHIYFTDDNWGQQRGSYGGHDIGAFDMESKEIECLNFGVDTPSDYSRPIWLTPTLR